MGSSLAMDAEAALSKQEHERVRLHLQWLFGTPAFAGSKRSCTFLSYVVEETLAGRAAQIKERNIGVDVFGKDVAFDPQEESLVRVCAGEVRRRLSRAYTSDTAGDVRVELPVGSYCPVFHVLAPGIAIDASESPAPLSSAPRPPAEEPAAKTSTARWKRNTWFGLAVLLCVSGGAAYGVWQHSEESAQGRQLDRLWEPFTNQKQAVLIALPSPTVYTITRTPTIAPAGMIPAVDLKASDGDFIGLGAGIGAARFGEKLAQRHQPFVIKSGKDVSFSDLSQSPAILLGGYTSSLGLELTRKLRLNLLIDATTDSIVDNQTGETWVISRTGPQAAAHEGYALITILRDSETGHPVMIVAGLRISDTQAAVDFLTNPNYFRVYTQSNPGDWSTKNCQIVLHSFDHGGSPGRAEVVASHLW